jgi:hypothetical protein
VHLNACGNSVKRMQSLHCMGQKSHVPSMIVVSLVILRMASEVRAAMLPGFLRHLFGHNVEDSDLRLCQYWIFEGFENVSYWYLTLDNGLCRNRIQLN